MDRNMRLTGPTPLPPEVLAATGRQVIGHRRPAFRAFVTGIVEDLRPVFGTSGAVVPLTCSGTGGLEAAAVNVVGPGDRVLAVSIGTFGDRFGEIARRAGADVVECRFPSGSAADPDDVRRALRRSSGVAAVLVTHNETSTGVLNPLAEVCRVVREESGALVLADVVSSLGATPVAMDAVGVDVAIGASQKALMAPPGLALVAVGHRAMAVARGRRCPSVYFDLPAAAEAVVRGDTAFTPAVPSLYGLRAALDLIHGAGLDAVFERHRRLAVRCRAGMAAAGFELVASDAVASPSLTAAVVPPGTTAGAIRAHLERTGIVVAVGRGSWKDRVIRVGHMGWVSVAEIDEVVATLPAAVAATTTTAGVAP